MKRINFKKLSIVLIIIALVKLMVIIYRSSWFSSLNESQLYDSACTLHSTTYVYKFTHENTSLCSLRSTKRGRGQRVLAVSLFGPKENNLFQLNNTLAFLYELIEEAQIIYPGWILRIYHDNSIHPIHICNIHYLYTNVDFCDMSNYIDIPQKTWRFIPAGDLFVDASEYLCFIHLHYLD